MLLASIYISVDSEECQKYPRGHGTTRTIMFNRAQPATNTYSTNPNPIPVHLVSRHETRIQPQFPISTNFLDGGYTI